MKCKLADICIKIGSGATPRGGKEAYCNQGISLVRSQNVLDFTFSHVGLAFINDEQASKLNNVEVVDGDVLLNITGDSVARACIMDSAFLPARVNQHVAIVRGEKDRVLNRYLLYFLQWRKGYLLQLASAGATRNALTKGMIEQLEIDLPSLDVQKKIVALLGVLDDKIELNNKINENLEQQAQAIFKSWFVDFEPFEGVAPKEWRNATLEEITKLVSRGIAPKYSDDSVQTVINQKCIRNHMIDLTLARKHTPKTINEKWLQYGDLLINSTGTGTLGRTAQVWFEPKNLTVDSHVTIVRPAKENLIFYIGLWGISHEKEIESLHTGSTGQTELPRERVKAIELLLPDNETLDRFNAIIAPMAAAIVSNQKESQKLATLRDTLLPKLMSGDMDFLTFYFMNTKINSMSLF